MASKTRHSFRPNLENLEKREIPAVYNHGGPVLAHVQAENLYLGSMWNQSGGVGIAHSLQGFTSSIVSGRYMDVLGGYGVGRGYAYAGSILNYNLGSGIKDGQIEWAIQQSIHTGQAMQPGSNNLYIVFVEPGVNVYEANGRSSASGNFTGYHSFFVGTNYYGYQHVIHYAVIAYPGHGMNPSPQAYGYPNELAEMTDTASHEIGEAVTDPNLNAWYDDRSGEIGDITNTYHQYLGNYFVQLLSNYNDYPIFLYNGYFFHNGQTYRVRGVNYDAKHASVTKHDNAAFDAIFSEMTRTTKVS